MGITLKSEQKMDEMIDVLDDLQKYIPTVPDESNSEDDHLFFNIGIGVYMYFSQFSCTHNCRWRPDDSC